MNVAAIIPARMGSTRYPGKPLRDIQGMTMIEHVYRRTRMSDAVERPTLLHRTKKSRRRLNRLAVM